MTSAHLKPGWRMVKFGDIAENIAVRVSPAAADTDVYVGLEHLEPETLHLRRWGHPTDVEGDKLRFWKGDVIFARRRAYQRKLALAEFDGIFSAHPMVIRAKPKMILPEFLPFFLQSDMFMERAIEISVGSLSPTINWKTLRVQEFPLPSLAEQERIAHLLWAADKARQAWLRVQNRIRKLTGVVSTHLKDRAGESLITMGSLLKQRKATIINGPFGTVLKASSYQTEGTPLVNPTHISEGHLDTVNCPKLNGNDTLRLSRYATQVGDILIGRKGEMDRVLLIDETTAGVITGTDCLRIRLLGASILPRYLSFWLMSPYVRNWLSRFAHGTTMPGINEKTLHQLEIPMLSMDEQLQAVDFMENAATRLKEANEHLQRFSVMLRELREQHTAGNFGITVGNCHGKR